MMVSKFKPVLSDDELDDLVAEYNSNRTPPARNLLKAIEQAVQAKQAEQQEPIAWLHEETGDVISSELKDDAPEMLKGYDVPLYKCPDFSCKGKLDSSNHIADMRKKVKENHIPDASKMVVPEYAEVYVGDGLFAICDWQDWDSIKSYKWSLSTRGRSGCLYAQTKIANSDGTRSRLAMHHAILPQKEGFVVDHINGNGLDNRRDNLRYATIQQNSFNQKIRKASSIYKGVSFDKESGLWRATIGVNGKKVYGGRHETELEAAKAYDEMAKKYFGEFAVLNLASAASIGAAPKYTGDK